MNTYINWKLRNDWAHIPSDIEKEVEAPLIKSLKTERNLTLFIACMYTLIVAAVTVAYLIVLFCGDMESGFTLTELFWFVFFLYFTSVCWKKHNGVRLALKACQRGNYKILQIGSEESRWNSKFNAFHIHNEERRMLANLSFCGKAAKSIEAGNHCPVIIAMFPNEVFRMVAKVEDTYEAQGSAFINISFETGS